LFDLGPVCTAVHRTKKPELSPDKEQIRITRMLADYMYNARILRQIRRDRFPRLAKIRRHVDVNLKIARTVSVKRRICRSQIFARGHDARDISTLAESRHLVDDVFPCSSVAADLQ